MKKTTLFNIVLVVVVVALAGLCFWKNNNIERLEEEIKQNETSVIPNTSENNAEEEENKKLLSKINDLTAEIAKKEENIKELESNRGNSEIEISRLRSEIAELEAEIAELEAEIAELEQASIPETYTITYILARPFDNGSTSCIALPYDEDGIIMINDISYTINFDAGFVYQTDDISIKYAIVNNHFMMSDHDYTINREHRVAYAGVGDNSVIAKPSFYDLPTTIQSGETIDMKFDASNYVERVNPDGTVAEYGEEGSRDASNWVIYGADSITYDTLYLDADTSIYVQASGDLIFFVAYHGGAI